MYCPKQTSFCIFRNLKNTHGGESTKGKRKTARPLCTKRSMHVVLRASGAVAARSLLLPRNAKLVHRLLKLYSKQFGVRVYEYVNVGNHIHLVVRAETKTGFR